MILDYIIFIVGEIFQQSYAAAVFYPILLLAFLACVPSILRYFIFRR